MQPKKRFAECLAIATTIVLFHSTEGFIHKRSSLGNDRLQHHHHVSWIHLTTVPMMGRGVGGIRPQQTTTALLSANCLLDQAVVVLANVAVDGIVQAVPPEVAGISYSKASYYTVLGLYLMSFPGLWSQIKRSTQAKVKRKTFISPGENNPMGGGLSLRQQAGEIMAYMKSNNYEVVDAGETILFRGIVQRSLSQAFFLTFCTALGLLSLALVLQIQFQDLQLPVVGGTPNWFYLAWLSPYAGIYYWKSGDRVDDISVKLMTNVDETEHEITVQGSDEELERMWRTLNWQEKGMVKVEGILS